MASKKSGNGGRKSSGAAAKKALAQARSSKQRNNTLFAGGAVALLVVLIIVIAVAVYNSAHNKQSQTAATDINHPPATTATGQDAPPPWPAPTDADAAVRAAGLPMLDQEGAAEHIHAHLDVRANGQPVAVPGYVGIDQTRGSISPLHTHDASGTIHIESPAKRAFTLGEFFTEWGVSLSQNNIGALHADPTHALRVFVNGKQYTGNPAAITLNAHDEIAMIYGQPQPGEPIASQFNFQPGE